MFMAEFTDEPGKDRADLPHLTGPFFERQFKLLT